MCLISFKNDAAIFPKAPCLDSGTTIHFTCFKWLPVLDLQNSEGKRNEATDSTYV